MRDAASDCGTRPVGQFGYDWARWLAIAVSMKEHIQSEHAIADEEMARLLAESLLVPRLELERQRLQRAAAL